MAAQIERIDKAIVRYKSGQTASDIYWRRNGQLLGRRDIRGATVVRNAHIYNVVGINRSWHVEGPNTQLGTFNRLLLGVVKSERRT